MASFIARCVHGLEWVCASEIAVHVPNAQQLALARREVSFRSDSSAVFLQALRTADDLLLKVGSVPLRTANQPVESLLPAVARLPWREHFRTLPALQSAVATPVIDVVASVEAHRRYNRFSVENSLGPVIAQQLGGTYLRRTAQGREPGSPDLTCRIFVRADRIVATFRLTQLPLHRRPWKQEAGVGSLHPPVAAAMVQLADPPDRGTVLDPFCGDGTIVIEAALSRPDLQVEGSDLDDDRLAAAGRNATRAGVGVTFRFADAAALEADPVDAVVTNPPWNLSVDAAGDLGGGLDRFWDRLNRLLGTRGRLVAVTASELEVPDALGRRGFAIGVGTQLRLAGRLCHLVVASPPAAPAPALSSSLSQWRSLAIAEGVVTESGF